MQIQRPIAGRRDSPASRAAYSLVEVMVVTVIIGILVTAAIPSFQRAIEQSRADVAGANLRAVWAAERLYWLENHTYTDDLANLRSLGLLDPEVILSANGYTYSIASADAVAFQAVATRTGSARWTGEFTIDQTSLIAGTVEAIGQAAITPGFQ